MTALPTPLAASDGEHALADEVRDIASTHYSGHSDPGCEILLACIRAHVKAAVSEAVKGLEASWKEKCIEADTMRQHHKNAEAEIKELKEAGGPPFIRSEAIRNCREKIATLKSERDDLAALVVRLREFISECEVAEDRSNLDGDSAEVVLMQINEVAEEVLKLVPESLRDCVVVPRGEWQAAKDRIDELIDKNIEGAKQNAALESENRKMREALERVHGLFYLMPEVTREEEWRHYTDGMNILKAALQPSAKGGK